jgi:hypothetical protein
MDNVFGELQGTGTNLEATQNGSTVDSTNNGVETLGAEYDLDLTPDDEGTDEGTVVTQEDLSGNTNQDDEGASINLDNPTNQAFAQMRTQNKEYETKLNELDALAKAAGLQGVDDLIARTKENQIKKAAKDQGIPLEVAQELAEFRAFREQYEIDKETAAYEAKEREFVGDLEDFIGANNLSKESVQKLSNDLVKDGLTNDMLMSLPKSALNRVLSSYTSTNTQKMLERKDNIRHELPLNQTSQVSNDTVLKEIDDLARQFAGKM